MKPGSDYAADRKLVVHLTRSDDLDLVEALKVLLGSELTEEMQGHAERLRENEERILEWLGESPEHLDAFAADPVEALRGAFPELELPPAPGPQLVAPEIELRLRSETEVDPVAAQIFQEVWERLAAGETDEGAFPATVLATLASLGADYPPRKVDEVRRAFEAVFATSGLEALTRTLELVGQARRAG